MNVFINDLSAALIPNDEIKGLFRLCKTVLGDALIPGMTWREHSQEIRENITDLICKYFLKKSSKHDVFDCNIFFRSVY